MGNVYLADYNKNLIEKFKSDGTPVTEWTFENNQKLKYNQAGIAVDSLGNVYVVEGWDPIIEKFTPNNLNQYLFNTSWQFAPSSQSSGNLTSLAVDSLGNVYLADYNKNLIDKFSTDGTPITEWNFENNKIIKSGQIGIVADPSGNVSVVEGYDPMIERFKQNNLNTYTLDTSWQFAPLNSYNLTSLAVDSLGNVYLADYSKHFIEKFTTNGTLIAEWAFENNTMVKVAQAGIAVDSLGNVYVVKSWDPVIEKFTPSPVANFTCNVTNGTAPLSVQFNDTSTGSPTSWSWEFGDGNVSNEQNPLPHTYYNNGTYNVKLTVSSDYGSNSTNATINVSEPLVANFTNETNHTNPLEVQFNDTSTGNGTSWYWDFGDGTNSTEENPAHTYNESGDYIVTFTIINVEDFTSTDTCEISVREFQPNPNGYKFDNFPYPADLSLTLDKTTFLNVYGYDIDKKDEKRSAAFYKKHFINSCTAGNCMGMAATSLMLYNQNNFNHVYTDYGLASSISGIWNKNFNKFFNPAYVPENIQKWIMINQAIQNDEAVMQDRKNLCGFETVYPILSQNIKNKKYNSILWIDLNKYNAAHALVPYRISQTNEVHVYDCCHHGDNDFYLNAGSKTFSYPWYYLGMKKI